MWPDRQFSVDLFSFTKDICNEKTYYLWCEICQNSRSKYDTDLKFEQGVKQNERNASIKLRHGLFQRTHRKSVPASS